MLWGICPIWTVLVVWMQQELSEDNFFGQHHPNLNSNGQSVDVKSKVKVFVRDEDDNLNDDTDTGAMTIVLRTICTGELKI